MIRPLRTAHRRGMMVLSIALALLFLAALLARKPAPVNPPLPNTLLQRPGAAR